MGVYDDPADNAAEVTPHDTNALTATTRGLYIGVSGDVEVITHENGATVLFVAVPAGLILPVRVTHVKDNLTTATNIVALW